MLFFKEFLYVSEELYVETSPQQCGCESDADGGGDVIYVDDRGIGSKL